MRKPVLLILINTAILLVVFAMLAQSLFIVERVAVVRDLAGQVQVQRDGAGVFTLLATGDKLRAGDVVSTGAGSWGEFGWQDGTRWKLGADSLFTMQKAMSNPVKHHEIARFRLERGQVLMRMVKPMGQNSSFEIETPQAVAAVRGTIFSARVVKTHTQIKVFAGNVEVSPLGGAKSVSTAPGQRTDVSLLDFKTTPDTDQSEFLTQPAFLQPELKVETQLLDGNRVVLRGQTEAGDRVAIDGVKVPVLGNGAFVKRLKITAAGAKWKVESTDKHGAKTTRVETLSVSAATNPYPQ